MFSIDVIGQDSFLDMPTDSRELYFQLGMYADDEGYVSPRKVMRITGAGSDALSILKAKGFIYPFESGVIVITHWNQNNYIQSDRFAATTFKEEKKEYQLLTRGIPNVYKMDTQGGREVREVKEGSKKETAHVNIERPDILKRMK